MPTSPSESPNDVFPGKFTVQVHRGLDHHCMAVPHPAGGDMAQDVNLAIPHDPEPSPILVPLWNHQPLHRWGVGRLRVDGHPNDVLQGDAPVVEYH